MKRWTDAIVHLFSVGGNRMGMSMSARVSQPVENMRAGYDFYIASWRTGTPDIPKGTKRSFWCVIRHNGKIQHKHLWYLNDYVMPLSDSCDHPRSARPLDDQGDMFAWTGWHEPSCNQCDTSWEFEDKVDAWFAMPLIDDPTAVQSNAGELLR